MSADDEATVMESGVHDEVELDAPSELYELRVGRYVLLDPIGQGAFGSVWAAFDPELDRKVAIKIVQLSARGYYGGSSRASTHGSLGDEELLAEAQLPAQLSHPNVVSIHDVGWLEGRNPTHDEDTSAPGRALYIVMEFLGGPTLGEWLGLESRTWPEIIARMVEAGRGLEAAHARGMVHLDFKPGNVMFGEDGRPRVLDFGLARVRRRQPTSASGSLPVAGTPSYMAPEQHSGDEPDERADQFAFAVTCWQALWGERPYRAEGPGALAKLGEQKRAGPPPFPRAGAVPPHVRAALARALAPEPSDRFATMGELIAALEFDPRARRRRWLVGGALAIGIVAALVSASLREDPCALPDDRFADIWDADVERELAESLASASEGLEGTEAVLARVRAGLDDQIARWTEVRTQVCAASSVADGAAREQMSEEFLCLEAHLRRIGTLTQRLRAADREVVARAADSVDALADPESCLQARSGRAPRELDDATQAALLAVYDALAEAEAELALGRFETSLTRAKAALAEAEPLGDLRLLGEVHELLGTIQTHVGEIDAAAETFIQGLAAAERSGHTPLVVELLRDHASNEIGADHYDRAELGLEFARARLAALEQDHPELAIELELTFCQLRLRQHLWDEARVHGERGLALQLELDPEDEPARARFHLALANIDAESRENPERGRAHYESARELWTSAYGPNHPEIGVVWLNLGSIDFRGGDYPQTLVDLENAARIFAAAYRDIHPRVGFVHQNIAAVHMLMGDYAKAIEPSEQAMAVFEAAVGRESTKFAVAEHNHASLLVNIGRYAEALDLAAHALPIFEAELEPHDGRIVATRGIVIDCLWKLGRDAEADAHLARLEAALAATDPEDPRRAVAFFQLAKAELRAGDPARALELVEQMIAIIDTGKLNELDAIADAAALLGATLRALGRLDDAQARVEALAEAHLGGGGDDAKPTRASWRAQLELGNIARDAGRLDDARRHYDLAWDAIGGYEQAPVLGAEIAIARASIADDPARARKAEEILRKAGVHLD